MRGLLKVVTGKSGNDVADLTARIEADKAKASQAYSDIERLEDKRRTAESFEAARAMDHEIDRLRWEIERADAAIPELEEQLADARWEQRVAAFRKHKRLLTAAARKAMDLMEKAAQANAEILLARHNASQELGNHVSVLPLQWYGGICAPDLVSIWRRHTEQQLESMERAELTRPPKPRDPTAPQNIYRNPHPGPVVMARGEIISNGVEPPAPAKPAEATPAPAPAPAPKREPRRDGPPTSGQRQVHFLSAGSYSLPDGSQAGTADYVNLPEAAAAEFVKRGVANFVDVSAVAPAPVEGVAEMTLPKLHVKAEGKVEQ
jgi:hypothetical protein